MIFPKRDALKADRVRDITPISHIWSAHLIGLTVEDAPIPPGQGKGGHYYVYTLESMQKLIDEARYFGLDWELCVWRKTDDKVGNG